MGKRLFRLISSAGFSSLTTGVEGQFILQSGVTLAGTFVRTEEKKYYIKDTGGKIHCILISDIREVMLDKVTPY